ncbi:FAD-dependent oxidoreductase [Cryobacterium sp. TMT4-31]|uniref:FAD-dependent oxidoreductase n=1 Tax=Cryobacterium sp. TMT4-31 TaxID=1259259 RepID=UPI00106C2C0C|nr:FAD-dependent oxidoreductase [Cryobacterium sp. TMT4-31]TFC92457.1 FAD-dependent oxidoreductase [Cryobacterium sp. TMT4-31]
MTTRVDTLVLGGGAMGSAAAWELSRRSREVTLLERFDRGHTTGASHGASRNFNLSYSDPTYVAMLVEALRLWRELEDDTDTTLLEQVGLVNHGQGQPFAAVHAALTSVGFDPELLAVDAARERWPGIRFDTEVLYTPEAGRLNADASVDALQTAAAAHGARIEHGMPATRLTVIGDDRVLVDTDTEQFEAKRVIVTLGAWTDTLLAGLLPLPRLVVTQEQPAHFAVLDTSFTWPGFNHGYRPGTPGYGYWRSPVYGMHTPGEGIKAGWHGVGPVVDPDHRDFTAEPEQLLALRRYAREWLPGADPDDFAAISCTYTTTPDSNFVLDRRGPVIVGAGFSGHGFKFTPTVGRILADLTVDIPAPPLFALGR